jgi:hypothetical protein
MDDGINFNDELGPQFTIKVIQYTNGISQGVAPPPPFEVVMGQPVSHLFILAVGTKSFGYPSGNQSQSHISPQLTWAFDKVTRIDYSSGGYKLLTYASDKLTQILFYVPGKPTVRKVFSYNLDNTLSGVLQDFI